MSKHIAMRCGAIDITLWYVRKGYYLSVGLAVDVVWWYDEMPLDTEAAVQLFSIKMQMHRINNLF